MAQLSEPLLRVENVVLTFAGVVALDGVSCEVHDGELFAIIGPNGAGKTSLFNCISGVYRPRAGRILFRGRDVGRLARHGRMATKLYEDRVL